MEEVTIQIYKHNAQEVVNVLSDAMENAKSLRATHFENHGDITKQNRLIIMMYEREIRHISELMAMFSEDHNISPSGI